MAVVGARVMSVGGRGGDGVWGRGGALLGRGEGGVRIAARTRIERREMPTKMTVDMASTEITSKIQVKVIQAYELRK